jgi:hypothetical protein
MRRHSFEFICHFLKQMNFEPLSRKQALFLVTKLERKATSVVSGSQFAGLNFLKDSQSQGLCWSEKTRVGWGANEWTDACQASEAPGWNK